MPRPVSPPAPGPLWDANPRRTVIRSALHADTDAEATAEGRRRKDEEAGRSPVSLLHPSAFILQPSLMAHPCYDLVVIGSGPAGQKAALGAAKLGRRVAVVEREHHVGGVCIHTGTIPSKAIREAVLHLTGIRERSVYGDGYVVKHDITMDDLLYRCRHVVKNEVDVIRNQMSRNGVTMLFGSARFVDANTVRIERDGDGTE